MTDLEARWAMLYGVTGAGKTTATTPRELDRWIAALGPAGPLVGEQAS